MIDLEATFKKLPRSEGMRELQVILLTLLEQNATLLLRTADLDARLKDKRKK